MEMEIPTGKKTGDLFPYFLLLLAALGIGVTLLLRRTDLTYASLTIVVPMVLAALVLIINRRAGSAAAALPAAERILFPHLFLINCLIFIISLIILVIFPTRPLIYFILMSVFSGLIFLQILSRRPNWTNGVILCEIVFLSLNLLWGVTLKYPLYFLDTDSMGHLQLIMSIVDTAHVESYLITYQYYPLYHVFTAMGIEITDMPARTTLFVMMGLAWQTGIIFAYLIFRDLTNSGRLALIACLIFASSSQIIFYGSYSIARSLAFVFLMCWLYLVFGKATKDGRYFFLSLIAMAAMIVTHHINVLLVLPVLFLVYLCQLIFKRYRPATLVQPLFIFLVMIASLSYLMWVATDMTSSILPGTIRGLITTETSLAEDYTSGYGLSVMVGALYYSFVLLLCLLGMKTVLNSSHPSDYQKRAGIFAFAAFPLLIVYIPGVIYILPMSEVVFAQRLQLIVTPFIAFLTAFGIVYLLRWKGRNRQHQYGFSAATTATGILLMIMTFTSLISTGNAQDYDRFPHTSTIDTPYFTEAELNSFSFLREKADPSKPLYSDYQTMRNVFMLNAFTTRNILTGGDASYIQEGYINLRVAELNRKTALSFSPDGRGREIQRYKIDPSHPEQNIFNSLTSRNRVYSNGDVQVFAVGQ